MWPKLKIEPREPTDGLFHADHEHRKEVWGSKCVKDFMIKDGRESFDKSDLEIWFKPTHDTGNRQPQVK